MDATVIASNLLSPPVLFFFLGLLAVAVKSDLDLPQPLPRLLSLYLLLSLGFKGGVALHSSGFGIEVVSSLALAILMSVVVPLGAFAVLRRKLTPANAAAIAAAYGSVSAVTFITATAFLDRLSVPYGGHMIAAMALMESPAIIIGVMLARRSGVAASEDSAEGLRALLREALFNGAVLLLLGSLVIGLVTSQAGEVALKPFTTDIFQGMLALFLLDMGIVSGRRLGDLRRAGAFPPAFALITPIVSAAIAITLARVVGLPAGDALLLTVLCASASYIAVPAVMRHALPEANPGLYVSMALAITFPFNVALGIPLYMSAVNALWR
jgi:hypothetical protein